jgi:2-desacetyl-2-hydroxyethyl bacteriochlorophyllide A dehydrogenase
MSACKNLIFCAPHLVEVRTGLMPEPAAGHVLVETIVSAISPGTEMLVYRGQFPNMPIDSSIEALSGRFAYPLAYGYSCVGRVISLGSQVDAAWLGKMVFSFQPHCSHFCAPTQSLLPVPESLTPECACFLPAMETAVNLLQDGAPLLGEQVLVLGQGIVGLMTASLLAEFPLQSLVCADPLPFRRAAALSLGADAALDPSHPDFISKAKEMLKDGADLSFELSGVPLALNDALALTVFSGRIVIGSWYGDKLAAINLGGSFHRSRIKLIASQVSTIAPELSGRWDKTRRFEVAWQALKRIHPEKWITRRFPLEQAEQAYRLLDEDSAENIQVVFEY